MLNTDLVWHVTWEVAVCSVLEMTDIACPVICNVHLAVIVDPQSPDDDVVNGRCYLTPRVVTSAPRQHQMSNAWPSQHTQPHFTHHSNTQQDTLTTVTDRPTFQNEKEESVSGARGAKCLRRRGGWKSDHVLAHFELRKVHLVRRMCYFWRYSKSGFHESCTGRREYT